MCTGYQTTILAFRSVHVQLTNSCNSLLQNAEKVLSTLTITTHVNSPVLIISVLWSEITKQSSSSSRFSLHLSPSILHHQCLHVVMVDCVDMVCAFYLH